MTLQWTVPSNGHSPITGHVIYYSTRDMNWVTIDFNANTTQTIRGLQGNTEYFFRVAAKNAVGTSERSLDSLPIITKIGRKFKKKRMGYLNRFFFSSFCS